MRILFILAVLVLIRLLPFIAIVILSVALWGEHQKAERHKAEVDREIEACNSSKLSEELEAERAVAAAQNAAHEREVQDMLAIIERESRAAAIAREGEELAESRAAKVRKIIEGIPDEEACIDTAVPSELIDGLFDKSA